MIDANTIDYAYIAKNIPLVMNAMYHEQVLNSVSLAEIRDAFRVKQIQGKAWLLNQMVDVDKNSHIFVIGGWLGFTSLCLYTQGLKNITECDLDARIEQFSKHLNRRNTNFKHMIADANYIDLTEYDVIINTSCEHMNLEWFKNLKPGQQVLLQSTDIAAPDHINLCKTLDEMVEKYNLSQINYADTLDLDYYKRFMLIGRV